MDHDASRAVGRHTFGDVHVDGHAAAFLGDYNVQNHAALSLEERDRIARSGTLRALRLDKYHLLT